MKLPPSAARAPTQAGSPGSAGAAGAPATTPHHQPSPGATLGFVFICPGRHEAARGYPCAAGTGANLARALAQLHADSPALFPSACRSKYVVTNAWDRVEYPALTGRSVPTVDEVLASANLERLAAELAGLQWVVACGAQAHAALRALQAASALPAAAVAYERHLSQRAVNGIAGGSDTPSRLRLWCVSVLGQFARPGEPAAARDSAPGVEAPGMATGVCAQSLEHAIF
jgi:hypothetical protein